MTAKPALRRRSRRLPRVDEPSVSQVVGATLADLGVDTVFGLLGSGNAVVTNALVAGGATYHAARHEGGATAMADGWARVTGCVGVVSVHQGPGLTNTLTALAEAAKSRTPLLVLAGDTPAAARRSNFRIDQHGLVEAVGAIADRVDGPGTAAADAARALRRARVERRPVVLMLPIDVQTLPVPADARALAPATPIPAAPAPSAAVVTEAAALLAGARRPLIIAGRGAVLANAGAELEALGAHAGALLATTAVANGLFAGLPYALGISGGFATALATGLLPQADVILAFGARLNHWTTRHGALLDPDAIVIQIDLEADAIGANRPANLGILGDARLTAAALLAELRRSGDGTTGWRSAELATRIAAGRWRDEPYEDEGTEQYIDPRTLSIALADLLPAEVTVAVDSGHFLGYPSFFLEVPDARSWLFVNAFQAVGLGLGNAIGAAVARPDRVTVAALGDGGTFLALAELETAARLGLRLLVVVYDDAAYGAEVHHFRTLGEEVGLAQFPAADIAAIARACGAAGIIVRSVDDLAPVADWLRDGAGPLVVDAKVNPDVCADWLHEAFETG
jgi:thiamine pyrophosphate-dependent acetolactate synthase large subunit-like protein